MPLPTKSRYTIAEAAKFIASATGERVTQSQLLDWGSQGLYRLHLAIECCNIRAIGTNEIIQVRDSTTELRLSSGQAAILGRGERIGISACWHNGIACNFVRRSTYDSSWTPDEIYFGAAGLVLLGAELDAFTASIAKPEQTAPATQAATPSPAPVVEVGASGGEEPAEAGPLPLTTGDIAFCFAGLRWDEQQWKKPLGDKPKWLAACIAIPGVRGLSETRWNPVLIGAALERQGHAKQNSIRAKFQTQPQLAPWLDAWKTYEADNFSI